MGDQCPISGRESLVKLVALRYTYVIWGYAADMKVPPGSSLSFGLLVWMVVVSLLNVPGTILDELFLLRRALVFAQIANKCYILKAFERKWHVLYKMLSCSTMV